jgi:TRAP-type C4-dicarboxylate transport system permease small subunit
LLLNFMDRMARSMAILGGLVLTVLIVLTCISVLGRGGNTFGHSEFLTSLAPGLAEALIGTGIGPVRGDFELVEAGIAFAIFAFLPLCQLHGGHATVDVFTSYLPARINNALIAFWEVLLSATILLITWRLFEGLTGKFGNGEITYILQFPVWYAYAASFAAAVIASVVALYCAAARVTGLLTGRSYRPASEGASH